MENQNYKDDESMEKRMSDAYMMERRIVLMEMMTTVMEKRMSDGYNVLRREEW